MKIDQAVKKALKRQDRGCDFHTQLKSNQDFQRRMEQAGVVTRKQGFTIPLMERIVRIGH
jgi:hypothetical protein